MNYCWWSGTIRSERRGPLDSSFPPQTTLKSCHLDLSNKWPPWTKDISVDCTGCTQERQKKKGDQARYKNPLILQVNNFPFKPVNRNFFLSYEIYYFMSLSLSLAIKPSLLLITVLITFMSCIIIVCITYSLASGSSSSHCKSLKKCVRGNRALS